MAKRGAKYNFLVVGLTSLKNMKNISYTKIDDRKNNNRKNIKYKKGLNQIDWAIALALFIMYLVWLIIIARPAFIKSDTATTIETSVKDYLYEFTKQSLTSIPIFLDVYKPGPVVVDKPSNFNSAYMNKYYDVFEDKIIFLENATGRKIENIILSNFSYELPTIFNEFLARDDFVMTNLTRIDFDRSKVDDVIYRSEDRIIGFTPYIRNNRLLNWKNISDRSMISAQYKMSSDELNITTFAFDDYDGFYMDIVSQSTATLEFTIDNFDMYYSNYYDNGNLVDRDCYTITGDFINFYDAEKHCSMSINLDNNYTMELCVEDDVVLKITIDKSTMDDADLWVDFHDGNYDENVFPRYRAKIGMKKTIEGLSKDKIIEVMNSDYNLLKDTIGVKKDFRLKATIDGTEFEMGATPYKLATIESTPLNYFELDKFGNMSVGKLLIMQWQ